MTSPVKEYYKTFGSKVVPKRKCNHQNVILYILIIYVFLTKEITFSATNRDLMYNVKFMR